MDFNSFNEQGNKQSKNKTFDINEYNIEDLAGILNLTQEAPINKDKIDKDKSIIIAEGFSTIASIYKSIDNKDINFVSCLNAGNMLAVVESIKATYPTQQIILMADNDEKNLIKNLTNIGLDTANEIKEKYSDIKVLYPKFTDDEIKKEKLSDFNDLVIKRGIEKVKKEIENSGVKLEIERGLEIER